MQLSIANVINVSVSEAGAGAGQYNTSNLALFSRETPGGGFGSLGYKIYLSPTDVATDFGSNSETYLMSLAVFSQKPNILAGRGYLVVIPFVDTSDVVAVQRISFSAAPASGNYKLNYGSDVTGSIAWDADAATIQTAIRTLTGLEAATSTGTAATHIDVTFTGVTGAAALLVVSADSLQTATPVNVVVTVATTTAGTTSSTETLAAAITRTADLVQYFGIITAEVTSEVNGKAAAAVVQALNKIQFLGSRTQADIESSGYFDDIATSSYTQSRCLYYGSDNDADLLGMVASYASRALSVDFSGSNTTINMHLKDLIGVEPDPTMTQTILNLAQSAGADCYVSLQGVAKTFCSGANKFFDQVYNLQWFVGAIQIAGFNYLAQSSTKIPQTENGMSGLKNAYRQVSDQAVTNQYLAPGVWNSADTFGNLNDFNANIEQVGYYIYSAPVGSQLQADREARIAPLVQIAIKEAGAIDSSNVIIFVNA